MMLMISVVNAGERPKVYFRFKEIPTVPPSPKFEAKTKELTPIAIKKYLKDKNKYFSDEFYIPLNQHLFL